MNEHGTWLDFLQYQGWTHDLAGWNPLAGPLESFRGMFGATHFSILHIAFGLLVIGWILFGAMKFRAAVVGKGREGLIPSKSFGVRAFFELICDTVMSLAVGVMGDKLARKFFPLIGALAFFIFFSNLLALIPGMGVPTTTLKTNLALSLIVFFATHIYGVKEHGAGSYIKHFMGPIWWMAPLILVIELISHLVRPLSLAIRLMGNMAGDHKVVFTFFTLVPILVPVPFLLLGVLVCIIQTVVFCLLSMVYISMALSHDH